MEGKTLLIASLLVVWRMTVFINCDDSAVVLPEIIKMAPYGEGLKLSCADSYILYNSNEEKKQPLQLEYEDLFSGEYKCSGRINGAEKVEKISVKFRTCENCIEVDKATAVAILLAELVVTVMIGVAVYLVASQCPSTRTTGKKASDSIRPLLSPTDTSNDHYEPLSNRNRTSEYSKLPDRR